MVKKGVCTPYFLPEMISTPTFYGPGRNIANIGTKGLQNLLNPAVLDQEKFKVTGKIVGESFDLNVSLRLEQGKLKFIVHFVSKLLAKKAWP